MTYKQRTAVAGYLLILPYMAGMLVFYLAPYLLSLGLSLTQGVGDRTFVGLDNYISLFHSEAFLLAGRNMLVFTFTAIPLLSAVSLGLALYLNDRLSHINVFRSLFILPMVLPTASIILFWQILFDDKGIVNHMLNGFGMQGIDFLNSPYAMPVVILIFVWKYSGYSIVLFLSGLGNINPEFYESAAIDGAPRRTMFLRITLPLLKPTAFLVFILSFINSLKIFREVYLMSGAYPNSSIYMMQHFMNNNMRNLNYPRLTSASTLLSVIIVAVVIFLYLTQRKADVN